MENNTKQGLMVSYDGALFWYDQQGVVHRDEDMPAVIYADGHQEWYKNGKLHRDGNKPAVIWPDGSRSYYKSNKLCVKTISKDIDSGS